MSTPHAITRAKERYGIDLTEADLADLAAKTRRKDGMLIGRQTDGCEDWAVYHGATLIRVVVNSTRERVITILPQDAKTPSRQPFDMATRS